METGGNILTDSIQNDRFSPPALLGRDPRATESTVEETDIMILLMIDRYALGVTNRK
jgi:hypothetical protein